MRKFVVPLLFLIAVGLSLPGVAQKDKKTEKRIAEGEKQMNKASARQKAIDLTGVVQTSGEKRMFLNDSDQQQWSVANPDMLRGHEGLRVKLKATPNSSDKSLLVEEVKDLKQPKAKKAEVAEKPRKKKRALIF